MRGVRTLVERLRDLFFGLPVEQCASTSTCSQANSNKIPENENGRYEQSGTNGIDDPIPGPLPVVRLIDRAKQQHIATIESPAGRSTRADIDGPVTRCQFRDR